MNPVKSKASNGMKEKRKIRPFIIYIQRPDGVVGCWQIKAKDSIAAELKAERRIGKGEDEVIRVEEVKL